MVMRSKGSNPGTPGLDAYGALNSRFKLVRQTGSAGVQMAWKMFEASRRSDSKECTVFVFDKRMAEKLHKPKRREAVCEILRREVTNLEQYKHHKILQVWHTIPENNDFLAFVSEPVVCSLANLLGNYDRLPQPIPEAIKNRKLNQFELKHGTFQVNEALKYLHNVERVIHGNVAPASIVLTRRGQWKLCGLCFVQKAATTKGTGLCPWNPKQPKMTQPDLDYMAPEVQMNGKVTMACDIFSLGLVICSTFTDGKSLLECNKSPSLHMRRVDELSQNFTKMAGYLPLAFIEVVEKMLSIDIRSRPTSSQFSQLKCFAEPMVLSLEDLLAVEAKAADERRDAFVRFIRNEVEFPEICIQATLFPLLMDYFMLFPDHCSYILPCILRLIRDSTQQLFKDCMYASFIQVILRSPRHSQKNSVLMEYIDWYVDKLNPEDLRSEILPICTQCLESTSLTSQEAALKAIPYLQTMFDESTIRTLLLPKAKFFFGRSQNIRTKVAILECVAGFVDQLDKMTIIEQVLPFLTEIHFSDTELYKTVIGLYKHMLSDKKFGLTHNILATKVLPHLIPYTVNPSLNGEEFSKTIEVLRAMLEKIEYARVCRMKSETTDPETPLQETENRDVPQISTELPSPSGFYLPGTDNQSTLNPFDASNIDKSRTAPTTPEFTVRKPWQKTGSSPSMEPRQPRKSSSHLQVIGQSHSIRRRLREIKDDKGASLLVPASTQRRHSYGAGLPGQSNNNSGHPMITASVCEGPFKSPPNSRPSSRRPSAQYCSPPILGVDDKLVVIPATRRSSFNALGDAVLGLFSNNKT